DGARARRQRARGAGGQLLPARRHDDGQEQRGARRGRGAHGARRRAQAGDDYRGAADPRPARGRLTDGEDGSLMLEYGKIKVARADGVETITLSYPERRNAIGPRMSNELLWALEDARAADDVKAIVLTGEGKAFCSGGDFAEMTSGTTESKLPPKGDYADLL